MGTQSLLTLFLSANAENSYGSADFLKINALSLEHFHGKNLDEAKELIKQNSPHLFLLDAIDKDLLVHYRKQVPKGTVILLTDLPMEQYSRLLDGNEVELIQHVIAREEAVDFMLFELRACLKKHVSKQIFGIEKYLRQGTKVEQFQIQSSRDRLRINQAVQKSLEQNGLSGYYSRLAIGIAEELMMNAIYDAPAASGKERYKSLNRQAEVNLDPADEATFRLACDGRILAISVSDPFGKLSRDKVFQYLRKVLVRTDTNQLIDTKELGAGLGLYKILYSCHSLVFNVQKSKQTEVLALIDCDRQLRDFSRMARSIQYFEIDEKS